MTDDRKLIEDLGGPTKVAELLNYPKQGGAQRVQNWMTRGIPAKVKVEHPELFMPDQPKTKGKSKASQQKPLRAEKRLGRSE